GGTAMKFNYYTPEQIDQLVCEAFARDEVQALLLGEKHYGYKKSYREDWTSSEEKTDILSLYCYLVEYYLAQAKNPVIPQQISTALLNSLQSHWGIMVITDFINLEASERHKKRPSLDLDLNSMAARLRAEIYQHKAELVKERLYGGTSFDRGM